MFQLLQIIEFLLNCINIEVNAHNSNHFTALDILFRCPRDIRDMSIKESLIKPGAARINEAQSSTYNYLGPLMVVAALLVKVSFVTASFLTARSPPGGVWKDDYLLDSDGNPVENPHSMVTAVMAYIREDAFGLFMVFNTITFFSSIIILLVTCGLTIKRHRSLWLETSLLMIAISVLPCVYYIAFIYDIGP